MIARVYRLTAAAGQLETARAELSALARLVGGCDGCLSAEAFQDTASPGQLVFIERWSSEPAYEAARPNLPSNAFAGLGRTLAASPEVAALKALPSKSAA